MKRLSVFIISILAAAVLHAQQLGDYSPAVQKYGLNKIGDSKRIYLNTFNINYQVFNERTEFKQGGYKLGGGVSGDATAALAIALSGVSEEDLIKTTDKLYAEFVETLTAAGYTFIAPEEAASIEAFDGWTRMEGGSLNRSQYAGCISVSPTGYSYFVKKVAADGKQKKAPLFSNIPFLSKQLGDAIIAEVDITIMFTQEGANWNLPGGAKIKMKPNLRVVSQDAIVNDKKNKGFISLKGAQSVERVVSKVGFHHGKVGAGATSSYTGTLKKPLEIEGVVDEKRIVTFARQKSDTTGVEYAYHKVYSAEANDVKDLKVIEIDSGAYAAGAHAACQKLLQEHTKAFLAEL